MSDLASISEKDGGLLGTLITWLRKRGEPDSGITYSGPWSDEVLGESQVRLFGPDADFIAKHFHGQGARDLAAALASPAPAESGEPAWHALLRIGEAYNEEHGDASDTLHHGRGMIEAMRNSIGTHPPSESSGPSTSGVGVTAWLLNHEVHGERLSQAPITDGDRSLGWVDTPLRSVPDGWVLVPRELTSEMKAAVRKNGGMRALAYALAAWPDLLSAAPTQGGSNG